MEASDVVSEVDGDGNISDHRSLSEGRRGATSRRGPFILTGYDGPVGGLVGLAGAGPNGGVFLFIFCFYKFLF